MKTLTRFLDDLLGYVVMLLLLIIFGGALTMLSIWLTGVG